MKISIQYFLIPLFMVVLGKSTLFAQPANDLCSDASTITIPNGGFGFGTVTSTTFDITDATKDFGEYINTGLNNGITMWYKFSLPTTRNITITLKQPGSNSPQIGTGDAGFNIFYKPGFGCNPVQADEDVPNIGSSIDGGVERFCNLSGEYLIQVVAKTGTVGDLFLEFTDLDYSKSKDLDTLYDVYGEAYNFGTLPTPNLTTGVLASVRHRYGCHSIESDEFMCSAAALSDPEVWNKTAWYTFNTGTYFDMIRFAMREVNFDGDNNTDRDFIVNVFEGDVNTVGDPPNDLIPVDTCNLLTIPASGNSNTRADVAFSCNTLQDNTTYSIQVIYPRDYKSVNDNTSDEIELEMYKFGKSETASEDPKNIDPAQEMGSLAPGAIGIGTNYSFQDAFGCDSYMEDLSGHGCPTTIIDDTITVSGTDYNLNFWGQFQIDERSTFNMSIGGASPTARVRVYTGDVEAGDCTTDLTLFTEFTGSSATFECMPADVYSVQVLGRSGDTTTWISNLGNTNLADCPTFNINVKGLCQHDFHMRTGTEATEAEDLGTLPYFSTITSTIDTFDCDTTPLPATFPCPNFNRAIYRKFVTDARGVLTISSLSGAYKYRLYTETASPALSGGDITGLTPLDERFNAPEADSCETNCFGQIVTCIDPGTYWLVTFGDDNDVCSVDNISLNLRPYSQNLGARNPGEWQEINGKTALADNVGYQFERDTYDCDPTPLPTDICEDGCDDSNVMTSRAMYRVFEVDQTGWLTIDVPNGGGCDPLRWRFYKADTGNYSVDPNTNALDVVGNLVDNLIPHGFCNQAEGCMTETSGDRTVCIDAGRYVVVSFGDSTAACSACCSSASDVGRSSALISVKFNIYNHQFGLYGATPTAGVNYDQYNGGAPLSSATVYNSVVDTFDCDTSRMPTGACKTDQATYRYFKTTFSSSLVINRNGSSGAVSYRLYEGTPGGLDLTDADTVAGLTPVDITCEGGGCNVLSYDCLPAGDYFLVGMVNICDVGAIDQATIQATALPTNNLGLRTANEVDSINGMVALDVGTIYVSTQDTFDCGPTAVVDSVCVPGGSVVDPLSTQTIGTQGGSSHNAGISNHDRAMFRLINVGTQGVLTIYPENDENEYNSGCCSNPYIHVLYRGHAQDSAITNGTFGTGNVIANLEDMSGAQHNTCGGGCCGGAQPFKVCVTPGVYTLVTLAGCNDQITDINQPRVVLDTIGTPPYTTDITAENLDTLNESTLSITASKTWVTCDDNPLVIDGQAAAAKQFYREFYLDVAACWTFNASFSGFRTPSGCYESFTHKLFSGRATDGAGTLSYEEDLSDPETNNCMAPGWYTIVSYGEGYTWVDPHLCTDHGDMTLDTTWFDMSIQTNFPKYNSFANADTEWLTTPITYPSYPGRGTNTVPVMDSIYCFDFDRFHTCTVDTPFIAGLTPCTPVRNPTDIYDKISVRVFSLAKPSYAFIYGLTTHGDPHALSNNGANDNFQSKLYAGDVRSMAAGDIENNVAHGCIFNDMRACLPAGTYTLVTFARDVGDCNGNPLIYPRILVDTVLNTSSAYDLGIDAYDFGLVPGDDSTYYGAVGSGLDAFGRPESNDFFIPCVTSAADSDPDDNTGGNNFFCFEGDHDEGNFNQFGTTWTMTNDSLPLPMPTVSRQNLWYTFMVDGKGDFTVTVDKKTPDSGGDVDACRSPGSFFRDYNYNGAQCCGALDRGGLQGASCGAGSTQTYKDNDVGFTIFVADDTALGDSTVTTLTEVSSSSTFGGCGCSSSLSKTYNIIPCNNPQQRYYVLVENNRNNEGNIQVDVGVSFDQPDGIEVRYDHYSTANHVAGAPSTQVDVPPYTGDTLHQDTTYLATSWVDLRCLTQDVPDQIPTSCPGGAEPHTAWYTYYVEHSGEMEFRYERDGGTCGADGFASDLSEFRLFRSEIDGDSTIVGLSDMEPNYLNNSGSWRRYCYSAGRYYVMFTGCDCNQDSIRPNLRFTDYPGDHCFDPIADTIAMGGVDAGSPTTITDVDMRVDCYSFGEGEGENGTPMGCITDVIDKKSGWYRIDYFDTIPSTLRFEMFVNSMAPKGGGSYSTNDIAFRVFTTTIGNSDPCANLTYKGNCTSSANTALSISCYTQTRFYVQVMVPDDAINNPSLEVQAYHSNCNPVDPEKPLSNFQTDGNCMGCPVTFDNLSSTGSNVSYLWDFGDGNTSNFFEPTHTYDFPITGIDTTITVTLIVDNTIRRDTTTVGVTLFKKPTTDFTMTPSDVQFLDSLISFTNNSSDTITTTDSLEFNTAMWLFCKGSGTCGADTNGVSIDTFMGWDAPDITYTVGGLKKICLYTTNTRCFGNTNNCFSCVDSVCMEIPVTGFGPYSGGTADKYDPVEESGCEFTYISDTVCVGEVATLIGSEKTDWFSGQPGNYTLLTSNDSIFMTPALAVPGQNTFYALHPGTCDTIPVYAFGTPVAKTDFTVTVGCKDTLGNIAEAFFANETFVSGPSAITTNVDLILANTNLPPLAGQIAFGSATVGPDFAKLTDGAYDNGEDAWQSNGLGATEYIVWRYGADKSVNRIIAFMTPTCGTSEARLYFHDGTTWQLAKTFADFGGVFDSGEFTETYTSFSTLWKLEVDNSGVAANCPRLGDLQIYASDPELIDENSADINWDFDDMGATSSILAPTHMFSDTGTYTVCLSIEIPGLLCPDTTCQTVRVDTCVLPPEVVLLPVELLTFDAQPINNNKEVLTYWATAAEIDNDYFNVERSYDAVNFETIGRVESIGRNTTTLTEYEFVDKKPNLGLSYYRLKQVDYDGSYMYSKVISVIIRDDDKGDFSLYPNPTADLLYLGYYPSEQNTNTQFTVSVLNITGGELFTKEVDLREGAYTFDMKNISPGVYVIKVYNDAIHYSQKVIKIN